MVTIKNISEKLHSSIHNKLKNEYISRKFRWILFSKSVLMVSRELEYTIKKKPHPFPSVFQIQTINLCNGSCIMCPYTKNRGKTPISMPDDLFEKIIREIVNESKSTFIHLYLQNEPLMDRNIFQKIQLIKKLSKGTITTAFITNGSLFTDDKIKELEKSENDLVIFSLDAFKKETYEKIRKGLNFDEVLNNLEKILKSRYKKGIFVEFVVQKDNLEEFNSFKKFWKKNHVPIITNFISNRTGDVDNFDNFCLDTPYFSFLQKFGIKTYKKIVKCCPVVLSSFNILSNGDVILCCNDYSKKLVLGNVTNSSIKEIWNSQKYQDIRQLFCRGEYKKIPVCRNCYEWEKNNS